MTQISTLFLKYRHIHPTACWKSPEILISNSNMEYLELN